jgi:heat-inducible transcriptional repressor
LIQTELLHVEHKLSSFSTKRIEGYFRWRLTGHDKPENLEKEEEQLSQKIYNELMVRYIIGYTNFTQENIYRTGFSRLLTYPDFNDAITLTNSLALFENEHNMRLLIKECCKIGKLKFWIGDDLNVYCPATPSCAVLAIPYYLNHKIVGAIGILGPTRIPYRKYFAVLNYFSECISEAITKSLYKFKISFRQPNDNKIYLQKEEQRLLGQSHFMLLEDKVKEIPK